MYRRRESDDLVPTRNTPLRIAPLRFHLYLHLPLREFRQRGRQSSVCAETQWCQPIRRPELARRSRHLQQMKPARHPPLPSAERPPCSQYSVQLLAQPPILREPIEVSEYLQKTLRDPALRALRPRARLPFLSSRASLLFANSKYFLTETSLQILPRQHRSALPACLASFDSGEWGASNFPGAV